MAQSRLIPCPNACTHGMARFHVGIGPLHIKHGSPTAYQMALKVLGFRCYQQGHWGQKDLQNTKERGFVRTAEQRDAEWKHYPGNSTAARFYNGPSDGDHVVKMNLDKLEQVCSTPYVPPRCSL